MNKDYILGAERLLHHITKEMTTYLKNLPDGPMKEVVRLIFDQALKLISQAITKLDDEVYADMDADTERKIREFRSIPN